MFELFVSFITSTATSYGLKIEVSESKKFGASIEITHTDHFDEWRYSNPI